MKKIYLVLTPVLLLLVTLSFGAAYVQDFESGEIFNSIFIISLAAVTFLSLGMMFREGGFRKTVWCRFAYVGTVILIMGHIIQNTALAQCPGYGDHWIGTDYHKLPGPFYQKAYEAGIGLV